MPRRVHATPLPLGLLVLALAFSSGCSGGASGTLAPDPYDPLPAETPLNDTPAHTLLRFEAAYESKALAAYELLFAGDYRFTFSADADPLLVSQYGESWGKDDEVLSTSHLFDGFTNPDGDFQARASTLALALTGARFKPDPAHADSNAQYVLVDSIGVDLRVELAGADGAIYDIGGLHRLFLVRGDAAFGLDSVQPADSTRWYVRRWEDRSTALFVRHGGPMGPADTQPAATATWGMLKAQYR